MNILFDYLSNFSFFTMTTTAFTTWVSLLLFMLFVVAMALICYTLCESWMVHYLHGKSAEDVKVQNWVADNNMREEICRHVAVYFGLLATCTVVTFFVANYHFIAGVVIEIVSALFLVLLCALRIIGAYGFNKELKTGTVNY